MSTTFEQPIPASTTSAETGIWSRLNAFFFTEERPVGLALVRILLPLVLLIPTLHRVYRVREFYSQSGSPAPIWNNYGQPDFLPIPTAPVAAGLYALLILALLSTSVGWRTRTSLLISVVLVPYFGMLDLMGTITKYTVVSTHVLLMLLMSDCGRIWSADRWLAVRRGVDWRENGPAWPRRLIQLLIGVIYLGAAATKMHTPLFFTGDQLKFWLLTNVNSANPVGEYLSQYPGMILMMVYVTIVWEILFLFTCWKGLGRTVNLSLGLFFHLMTYFTLGLLVFPLVYFCLYTAWYDQRDHEKMKSRWQNWFGRDFRVMIAETASPGSKGWRFPSLLTWAMCAISAVGLGVWIDSVSDPFGEHRPEGRYALKPISEERLAELLRKDEKIDVADKVFSLDIGSVMFNDNLVDRKTQFHYGEKAMIQCALLPPHEDLFMEMCLQNESGQIMRRLWQVVSRENLRGHFWFPMEESLSPGLYSVVVKINGVDAGQRSLELIGEPTASAMPAAVSGTDSLTEATGVSMANTME